MMIDTINSLVGCSLPLVDDDAIVDMIYASNRRQFDIHKLEKDFRLTVILHYISHVLPDLRFKGGTCLNKIYYPYFRLSEDLDFSMPIDHPLVDSNTKRESFARTMREKIKHLTQVMGRSLNDDQHHHKKAQGNQQLSKKPHTYLKYVISYTSSIDQSTQTIKIELTYSSKQYFPSKYFPIVSCFVHPLLESDIFPTQTIQCLDVEEMVTEKCRAAMTRRKPAIRDFFDLRYLDNQGVQIDKNIDIIIAKCQEVANLSWTGADAYDILRQQEVSDLKPMLDRSYNFNLDTIYEKVMKVQHQTQSLYTGWL